MSIHQRGTVKGRVYDVRLRGPDGREVSRTFRTKREAVEYEAAQRTAKVRGAWVDPRGANVTMAELSREWLESNPAKRQSTRARDESALRVHVLPVLGHRKIGALTPGDIRALVTDWSVRMAPRTVRRTYGTARAVLNYAVESDLLLRSPCRGIRLPAVEQGARRIVEPGDLIRLANSMPEEFAPMVWLGAVLGLRWGEVAGLRVGRIDLLRRTVTVAEQVTRGIGGVGFVSPPKSAAGHRTLTIPAPLTNLLSAHLAQRGLTGADADAFLFANADGGPLDYSNWRRRRVVAGRGECRPDGPRVPRLEEDQRDRDGPRWGGCEDGAGPARALRSAADPGHLRPSDRGGRPVGCGEAGSEADAIYHRSSGRRCRAKGFVTVRRRVLPRVPVSIGPAAESAPHELRAAVQGHSLAG